MGILTLIAFVLATVALVRSVGASRRWWNVTACTVGLIVLAVFIAFPGFAHPVLVTGPNGALLTAAFAVAAVSLTRWPLVGLPSLAAIRRGDLQHPSLDTGPQISMGSAFLLLGAGDSKILTRGPAVLVADIPALLDLALLAVGAYLVGVTAIVAVRRRRRRIGPPA